MPTKNAPEDAPPGEVLDDSYTFKKDTKNEPIPVEADTEPVEDPIDENTADTDAQLERDDKEAIDKSNIIKERTRGVKVPKEAYLEPDDNAGLETDA